MMNDMDSTGPKLALIFLGLVVGFVAVGFAFGAWLTPWGCG